MSMKRREKSWLETELAREKKSEFGFIDHVKSELDWCFRFNTKPLSERARKRAEAIDKALRGRFAIKW